mgnify:CR=1 FL=1
MSQGSANPAVATQNSIPVRTVFFGDYAAADEGSYFAATIGTATASTAVAVTTQALGTANPHIVIQNTNPAGGYNVYLRTIKLRVTTATTGITSVNHVGVLNPNPQAFTTVGTAFSANANVNGASGTTSRIAIYGGVNVCTTVASSSGARIVHSGPFTSIIPIVLDQWQFCFGNGTGGNAWGAVIGTTTSFISVSCGPVIIPPGWFYTFGLWGPGWAASAPSYLYDIAYIERPSGQ